jgi:hypothetical protein
MLNLTGFPRVSARNINFHGPTTITFIQAVDLADPEKKTRSL